MEFCSEYGYDYGFEGSENEDHEIDDKSRKIKTKIRKADTNIISVRFNQLVAANEMFAGEPKKCNNCGAFMSFVSAQNVEKVDDKFMWNCEFCEQTNDMSGVLEDVNEIPKEGDVTFLLEPAKQKAQSASASASNEAKSTDNTYLTFCMDVSGSMNTGIPAKGNARNISRLEGVKIACLETLNKLKVDEPEKQVNLVTFSSYVKYYGDCTQLRQPMLEICDEKELNDKEIIQSKAYNTDGNLKGIAQSHPNIEQRLKILQTEGSTALGPALFYSIVFASKKPGSSIILCTDGCANVGLGSVQHGNIVAGEKYYDEIADFAKQQGVVVNVLSMEGTDCKLALLGRVADRSNGTLNIVNPLNLSEEFKSILENRLVATNVQAKLIVNHKYLYIRNEENEREESKALEKNDEKAKTEAEKKRKSAICREIGNVNIDTEITFEYGIRKLDKHHKKSDALKQMPFQLQITYTASDGSKAVRVYTKMQKFTQNRREAESNIQSRDLLFLHKAQATTGHLLHDDVIVSKMKNLAYMDMYDRNGWERTAYEDCHFSKINSKHSDMRFLECNDMLTTEMYGESKMSRQKISKIKKIEEEEKKKRFTLPAIFAKKDNDSDDETKQKKKEEKIQRRNSKKKSKKGNLNASQINEEDDENNDVDTRKSCQIM